MVFSSTIFLFGFLPLVLIVYFLLPGVRARNAWLLICSLVFYAWGEGLYVLLLIGSILLNWAFGLRVGAGRGARAGRVALALAVAVNLALLASFKYANFAADSLSALLMAFGLPALHLAPVHLPIGISFFTFQALTYVVDIHRGHAPVQPSPFRVGLYIALFPQLIAGPIVRYGEIAAQLAERLVTRSDAAAGVRRFIVGLGKKVLLANTLAVPVDAIFSLPTDELHASIAWLGVICYALQIYFDFSGYSDMAIGIGRILGFSFPENFDHPYVSRSMREFWRRWHISLSTWFRDYLYLPLGGNRRSTRRTGVNLLVVFLLCGLWHGASWTFVFWGLFHGSFLALERTRFGERLARAPSALRHGYVLGVVLVAWVFFRSDSFAQAAAFLKAMVGLGLGDTRLQPVLLHADPQVLLALSLGVLGSTPWLRELGRAVDARAASGPRRGATTRWVGVAGIRFLFLQAVLVASAMSLVAGTHNPFIYFRF